LKRIQKLIFLVGLSYVFRGEHGKGKGKMKNQKRFYLGETFISNGRDLGPRWNGWAMPEFSRDQWEKIILEKDYFLNEEGLHFDYIEHDGNLVERKCSDCSSPCEMSCEYRQAWPINPDGSCEFGSGSWVWDDYEILDFDDVETENREIYFFLLDDWARRIQRDQVEFMAWMCKEYKIYTAQELNQHLSEQIKTMSDASEDTGDFEVLCRVLEFLTNTDNENDALKEAILLIRTHSLDPAHPLAIN
jgi:hypothetical protein